MNRPPMLMHVKIKNEKANFGIWLPLFLLFPLALVVLLVLLPLIIIAALILCGFGYGRWVVWGFRCLWMALVSSCALRGFRVDVQGHRDNVFISVV
jgi:uncharacterized membrane protein YdjX (TVP38/TMEM64 family)